MTSLPPTEARVASPSGGCALAILAAVVIAACAVLFIVPALAPVAGADALGPAVTIVVALLLAMVLSVALLIVRAPRLRAAIQAWLLALPLALLMLPASIFPSVEAQTAALLRVLLTGIYLLLLWLLLRWRFPVEATSPDSPVSLAFAAILAVPPLLPWLAWGALGSLLDITLGLFAAGIFGIVAALLVARVYLRPIAGENNPPGGFTSGTVIAILLFILGMNFGVGGQMPLLLFLPVMGWPAAIIIGREPAPQWRALALFVALVVAPPLLLADPDTLWIELFFQGREGIYWALSAASTGMLLALVSAGIAPALRARMQRGRNAGLVAALACWLGAAAVYGGVGQPGLYGDQLFVILKDQADLSAAGEITDYQARRRAVYDTLTSHAEQTQESLRADLDRLGIHYRPFYLVNALEVEGGLPLRLWLMLRSDVDRVVPNPVLRPLPEPLTVESGDRAAPNEPPWNLTMIQADRVWRETGVRGKGIVVGVMDSGVQWDHPELRDGYRGLNADGSLSNDYNWLDPWNGAAAPVDYSGHGTYTLSAAVGDNVGVAPDATWIGCVNLARNVGSAARYLECMQFMLAPFPQGGDPLRDGDPARGADITNNSWGCPQGLEGCDPNTLLAAADALRAAGMFTVAAAGNDGPACSSLKEPLALYDAVFTVGAVGRDREIASFSSVGPVTSDGSGRIKPDIAAPGANVLAAAPGDGYQIASGTSIAAPHITGVVALLWSANPALIGNVERTEEILRATVRPGALPDAMAAGCIVDADIAAQPNIIYGAGIVDAYQAVRVALGN